MDTAASTGTHPSAEQAMIRLKEQTGLFSAGPAYHRVTGRDRLKLLRAVDQARASGVSVNEICKCTRIPRRKLLRWRQEARTAGLGQFRKGHRPVGSLGFDELLLLNRILRRRMSASLSCRKLQEFIRRQFGRTISHVSIWKYKRIWGQGK